MEQVRFVIPGEPTGKGRPRFAGKNISPHTPEKTVLYENLVKVQYQAQCGGFRFPDNSMLDMRVLAYYRIPKSASKKKKALMGAGKIRPTKTPDCDNVIKVLADSMNGLAYRDDRQIVDCQVRKFYADEPRVEVLIKRVGGK